MKMQCVGELIGGVFIILLYLLAFVLGYKLVILLFS